ncbi:MAG: type III pantothenate kinase [Ruminococcaceae bacterium]|nr:type III pantothenate kinase [Oscillospiraceae bacterium]
MLLAVEIDNSEISFGLFDKHDVDMLVDSFKISADLERTSDEYAFWINGLLGYNGISRTDIDACILSSVVPQLTDTLTLAVKKLADVSVMAVGKGTKTGFPIKIDNPADLGADLVANAAAVIDIKSKENTKKLPCVIIDMGAATTVFAVNANGEYIGGSIMAGVGLSLKALHGGTALLPTVSPAAPTRAIGRNSQESVRSGVVLGNAMMIDGFISKFAQEMKADDGIEVFVTGEYAETVISSCTHKMRYIPELTLRGLCCIYNNNVKA